MTISKEEISNIWYQREHSGLFHYAHELVPTFYKYLITTKEYTNPNIVDVVREEFPLLETIFLKPLGDNVSEELTIEFRKEVLEDLNTFREQLYGNLSSTELSDGYYTLVRSVLYRLHYYTLNKFYPEMDIDYQLDEVPKNIYLLRLFYLMSNLVNDAKKDSLDRDIYPQFYDIVMEYSGIVES